MSDQHMDKHDEQKKKESNYKKFLLYGILLVLVVLVGYVIFAEDKKMYRLATETKLGLRQGVDVSSASTLGSTSSPNTGSSSSSNPLNLGLFSSSQSSSAPALTSATSSAVPPGNVMLSSTSGGSASEVRRELRELFRSYA
jgi:hypothetical protein